MKRFWKLIKLMWQFSAIFDSSEFSIVSWTKNVRLYIDGAQVVAKDNKWHHLAIVATEDTLVDESLVKDFRKERRSASEILHGIKLSELK